MNKSDLINSPIKEYERLLKMDFLIRNGNYPSVEFLASELEVTRRAIFRYRNILIEDFGAPLKISKKFGGYYYEDSDFTISDITLNEHESLVLSLAKRFSEMMLYGSDLYSSFSRGINSLNRRASKITNENSIKLSERIQFAFPHTDFGSTFNKYFEKLIFDGLQNGNILRFQTQTFTSGEIREFSALPVYIVMFDNSWLLLCIKTECFTNNFTSVHINVEDFILFDICAIKSIFEVKDSKGNKIRIKNIIREKGRNGAADSVPETNNAESSHQLWLSFGIMFPELEDSEEFHILLNFKKSEDYTFFSLTDNFLQEAVHSGKGKLDSLKNNDNDFSTLI